jgi:hypothetical protein
MAIRVPAKITKEIEKTIQDGGNLKSYCQSHAIKGKDICLITLVASMSKNERRNLQAIINIFEG